MRFSIAVLICLAAISLAAAQEPEEKGEKDPNFWMKQKLHYSQAIFQSLATADFESMGDAAQRMTTLNRVEAFVKQRNARYKAQLDIFQDASEELQRQAEKKNVEGAALAFHQLTLSCVNCHKLLRDERPR